MGESAVEVIGRACALLEGLSTADASNAEMRDVLLGFERLHRVHQSVEAQALADFNSSLGAQELGYRDGTAFLIDVMKLHAGEARDRTRRAELIASQRAVSGESLVPVLAHCARALRAGRISAVHVNVIAKTVETIPVAVANEPADDDRFATVAEMVEAFLVDHAHHLTPKQLEQDAQQLLEHLDPDGTRPREEEAKRRRELLLYRTGSGMWRIKGWLTDPIGTMLQAAIQALSAPDPQQAPDAGTVIAGDEQQADSPSDRCVAQNNSAQNDVPRGDVPQGDGPLDGRVAERDQTNSIDGDAETGSDWPGTGLAEATCAATDPPDQFNSNPPDPNRATAAETAIDPPDSPNTDPNRATAAGTAIDPPDPSNPDPLAPTNTDPPDPTEIGAVVGERDPRSATQRRHDALGELARSWLGQQGPAAGCAVKLVITMTLDQFRTRSGYARTGTGGQLAVPEALNLCDEVDLYPLITGAHGQPLWLGRNKRLGSESQTAVLIARDRGCSFPGCTAPPAHCQRHHIRAWAKGGRTDITNLCLLCTFHHATFETTGWECELIDGRPHWRPPAWLDPDRRPIRNTAHDRLSHSHPARRESD